MPGKYPAALEEVAHFELEHGGLAIGIAVDAEDAARTSLGAVIDEMVQQRTSISNLLRPRSMAMRLAARHPRLRSVLMFGSIANIAGAVDLRSRCVM